MTSLYSRATVLHELQRLNVSRHDSLFITNFIRYLPDEYVKNNFIEWLFQQQPGSRRILLCFRKCALNHYIGWRIFDTYKTPREPDYVVLYLDISDEQIKYQQSQLNFYEQTINEYNKNIKLMEKNYGKQKLLQNYFKRRKLHKGKTILRRTIY